MKDLTQLVTAGRDPQRFDGMANTPEFRGSTILHSTLADWEAKKKRRAADEHGASTYGRFGTPTHHALEEAVAALEGGYRSWLYPSGLAAISTALTALLKAGDHVLLTDSAYSPTRSFLTRVLARFGVAVTVYDPSGRASNGSPLNPNAQDVYS